jgi:uncharacterized protein (DUF305 family)
VTQTIRGSRTPVTGRRAAPASIVLTLALLAAAVPLAAQPAVQPGAPGEPPRELTDPTGLPGHTRHTEADVRFLQHMIVHHAQALEMTALVPGRTGREEIRLLASRIDLSQLDEIQMMREWLERRDETAPAFGDHLVPGAAGGRRDAPDGSQHDHPGHPGGQAHMHPDHGPAHDHMDMPGMISPAELSRLAAASGPEFDRLFLELMIHHHEGALIMVDELLSTDGAAQDSELFSLVSHIDADQRIEIERMQRLLRD